MTDLVTRLRAHLDRIESIALAASYPKYAAEGTPPSPKGVHWTWVVDENWTPVTPDPVVEETVGGPEQYGCNVNLVSVEEWPVGNGRSMHNPVANYMVEVESAAALHIVSWDPSTVLRLVARDRALLADFEACQDVDLAWTKTELLHAEIVRAAAFWLGRDGADG